VGYEMYCQLLEGATAELKDAAPVKAVETHVELQTGGHIPRRYIPSEKHRIEAYRRVSRALTFESLRRVEKDLTDAYGALPKAAQVLMAVAEIRLAAAGLGVASVKRDGPDIIFTTREPLRLSPRLAGAPGTVRLVDQPSGGKGGTVYFRPPANYLADVGTMLAVLRKLLVVEGEAGAGGKR